MTYVRIYTFPFKKKQENFNNYMNLICPVDKYMLKSNNIYKAWNPFKVVRLKPVLQSNLKRF